MESVDASAYTKTGGKIFELLDNVVEKVGAKNVVQVITDNGSNFKKAGQMLMEKRQHIYWTPCAAHCLDLMFEDIGKIKQVKSVVHKGISLVSYIYNHTTLLSMMRKFTENNELARCGVTRFATNYLTFKSLHRHKNALRNMFADERWTKSKLSKETKWKRANGIVFTPTFWNNITFSIKVMSPIVKVLRLVDNEKKPAMGYIYEAMERAKLAVKAAFVTTVPEMFYLSP
uniref:uncharacterized protein LOC122596902 n=1 Tax=Erigeron canadensis TaxID=72917 RepID=UPI001CB9B24F|nr:uncharacterized protein LOC122596902 [Erigeron canadensis]